MVGVWDKPLVFVDLETTGGSHFSSRVLEIGLVRVESGVVVANYKQLLDPGEAVPSFITSLTGITTEDTQGCPRFADVAAELADLLEGAIFVAHNARFDYSFLKTEFERIGVPFRPQLLCTVRLSRYLFPQFTSHKLEALISRHGLNAPSRHRAYDDAHCLWQFFALILREFDLDTIETAMKAQLVSQSVPSQLDREQVDGLPEGPGVYVFEGADGEPLYVGKSVNVRKRVLSHFTSDYEIVKEDKLARQVARISGIATHGELSALLLESEMVKSMQPMYNRQLRRRRQMVVLLSAQTAEGYDIVQMTEAADMERTDGTRLLGMYTTRSRAVESLRALASQFRLCAKLLGLEHTKRECFLSQLGKCEGACCGRETADSYNMRFDAAFERQRVAAWPYDGPIMIRERQRGVPGSTGYVIDNWCIVATAREYEDGQETIEETSRPFEMDTYKIIRQFTAQAKNARRIQKLGSFRIAWQGV
jgi:DNA polymerase-3 subunit epsilon